MSWSAVLGYELRRTGGGPREPVIAVSGRAELHVAVCQAREKASEEGGEVVVYEIRRKGVAVIGLVAADGRLRRGQVAGRRRR